MLRVEIVGPATIAPGESAQYSAVQFLSDGSSQPATQAAWSSSQPSLLQVDANGLATAQPPFRGDVILQVERSAGSVPSGARRGSREIVVLPDGTFRLVGTVTEADASNVPVGGARVEAAADANPSTVVTFATTGPDGRYKLYGVPADAHLRVVRDGYVTSVERIQLATHETRHFQLRLDRPRLDLARIYTMTIETSSQGCTLPEDLRRRTYDALVTQNGPQLTVTLTAPQFLIDPSGQGNRFSGLVTATGAEFEMRSFYVPCYYCLNDPGHPDVAELLPDGTLLVAVGKAIVSGTSARLSGRFSGGLDLYSGSRFPNVTRLGGCSAAGLTLMPR